MGAALGPPPDAERLRAELEERVSHKLAHALLLADDEHLDYVAEMFEAAGAALKRLVEDRRMGDYEVYLCRHASVQNDADGRAAQPARFMAFAYGEMQGEGAPSPPLQSVSKRDV